MLAPLARLRLRLTSLIAACRKEIRACPEWRDQYIMVAIALSLVVAALVLALWAHQYFAVVVGVLYVVVSFIWSRRDR